MSKRNKSKLFRRRGLGILALAASASLVVGCAGNSEPEEPSDELTGKVEIVWPGTSDPEKRLAEDFAAAMLKEGIEIEYNFLSWSDMLKQLAVRIQAGNPPGVTALQDITDLYGLGGLEPLDDLIAEAGVDLSPYLSGVLDYSKRDGKLYSLPVTAQAFTLIINEEMLNAAGYKVEDLTDWSQLEAAAKAMTKDGKYGFAIPGGNPRFTFRTALTAGYSNDLNIGEIKDADEGKWKELLGHLETMHAYTPAADAAWAYAEMFQAYSNGEIGIIAAGTFFTANVYAINPEIVGKSRQIAYPAGPSGVSQAPVSNMGYGVFAKTPNKKLAFKVVTELAKPEWIARIAAVVNTPGVSTVTRAQLEAAVKDVYPDAVEGQLQQLDDQMKLIADHGAPLVAVKGQSAMEPEFQEVLLQFLDGKMSLDEAYKLLNERLGAIQAANK